jgi:hypothetical protein
MSESIGCLGKAEYRCAISKDVCGRVWLLSAAPELFRKHRVTDEIPNLFAAKQFSAPLGLIVDCGFGDMFYLVDTAQLDELLQAIQSGKPEELYAINHEFLPFYCPDCRCCYDASHWSTMPVFDDGFYDFTEATCPREHRRNILD